MSETLPHKLQSNGWKVQPKALPLIVTLALLFALDFSIASFLEVKDAMFAGIVIGAVFTQTVLFAVWCTLAPVDFGTRLLSGSLAFVIATICMFLCAQRDGGGNQVAFTIAGAMFVQWLLYQLPLWHKRLNGWHLSNGQPQGLESTNEFQFGISQLLTWTTVVAVFLGVMRFLMSSSGERSGSSTLDVELFAIMALGNSLLVLPLIYACFSQQRMMFWSGIAFVWAITLSITQWFLLYHNGNEIEFILIINFAQFVTVFSTLLLVRLAGFRLHRRLA